jgi:hypothetical protein
MSIPKIFVSYSHDSRPHKSWVLSLATKLRASGVDAILDQWELKAGDDLPSFMEKFITDSDYILMICSENYVAKANSGRGGVGYEKMIVTSDLMESIDSNKVIPIIRQNGKYDVPIFLKTKLYIDMSSDELEEFGFDELIRTLHKSPLYKKPELGKNPFESGEMPRPKKPEPVGDGLKEIMAILIQAFNNTSEQYVLYRDLIKSSPLSRIMVDYGIDSAVAEDLITRDLDGDIIILAKGRCYAVEHGLV